MTTGFDLDEIERLLAAATPGDLSTAERHVLSEYVECPMCGGDGEVGATDYCNFDGVALGVQFYGIGHEFGAHEKLWVAARNSLPAMIAEIRELRAENARLKGHWSALDKALADNIIETDQSHRVRWEGEWHYGPLADAYFAMIGAVRDCARAALGEHQ